MTLRAHEESCFNFPRETETFLNSLLLHTQYKPNFPLIGCFISPPSNGFLQTVKVLYNTFQPQQLRLLNVVRRWAPDIVKFEKLIVSTITWSKTKVNPILKHIYHAECPLLMTAETAKAHISKKSKRLIHESVTRCVTRCQVTRVEHVIKNSIGNEIWSI